MSFFYISVPHLSKCKNLTRNKVLQAVLSDQIADGKEINVERSMFKMCNLDTLISINDKLQRLELGIEGFLKKVDRHYLQLLEKPRNDWFIRVADMQYTIPKYLYNFVWNQSKFPRSYPLCKIAEVIETKLNTFESEFRNILCSFSETRTQIHQNATKQGTYFTRDLTDILVQPAVSCSNFVESRFVTTLVLVVPVPIEEQFSKDYVFVTDYVIPGSAVKLNIPTKDNLALWTVHIFNERIEEESNVFSELTNQNIANRNIHEGGKRVQLEKKKFQTTKEQFIQKIKQGFKITVREFKFQAGRCAQNQKKKVQLQDKLHSQTKSVSDICLAFFAEGYQLYLHQKILKLFIESSMRYGNDPSISYLLEVIPGKEKIILDSLIKIFGDELNGEYYGSKQETEEPQDYYPFVYLPALRF